MRSVPGFVAPGWRVVAFGSEYLLEFCPGLICVVHRVFVFSLRDGVRPAVGAQLFREGLIHHVTREHVRTCFRDVPRLHECRFMRTGVYVM